MQWNIIIESTLSGSFPKGLRQKRFDTSIEHKDMTARRPATFVIDYNLTENELLENLGPGFKGFNMRLNYHHIVHPVNFANDVILSNIALFTQPHIFRWHLLALG